MTRIGVRELRQHASRYLDLVKRRQTVDITERGVLVAHLTPPTQEESNLQNLIADGRVIPAERPRTRLPQPVPAHSGRPDSAEVLDELREDRL